jgi:hypothetical protein
MQEPSHDRLGENDVIGEALSVFRLANLSICGQGKAEKFCNDRIVRLIYNFLDDRDFKLKVKRSNLMEVSFRYLVLCRRISVSFTCAMPSPQNENSQNPDSKMSLLVTPFETTVAATAAVLTWAV